ncbi:bifunctional 2-C-methyl-D-erythritol 4-phosphate cytidylyltransferase / 2-C-methyl-D-erythritol 2,4-cyclodiphosphate synthase protein [Campylobacter iguaniorum]|uniref:bifunctional 2-C-methyl-D-erythritol 4-phosphate cytidylyltransferase/2-C-methyl-D-erythritol 2,4-cyclodiphosphate synthase n=1 Tax=Campylobacter iguaniorum TaxID=1244531 RepID=UPI0007C8F5A0|nr:bifunctional 2-C-methyl-D-erythritol 4-phosphate cytidylyltransferase/2-C-methyl-D-erythritol 2,4-cyclodiphosphate synthase [Campylobacter iguaniorum]ANE35501.1 bifunctional 2-C-methyl-D-erythritol 4-phosphate cytidylyltransferase / 2-C-methyl-D-erythritol 2,4-cyclodiphosphate synthase protein [Campylobacter iguaniorum]
MLDVTLIMLGAGDSTRFGLPTKKQWLHIDNDPLWLYATKNLSSNYNFKDVIVVSKESDYMSKFSNHFKFIEGGNTRQESLKNALAHVNSEFVMVSDIARPNVPKELVAKLFESANNADCVVPALKVCDTTLFQNDYINRDDIKLIQTPQLSRTSKLREALQTDELFGDDSSAITAVGGKVWYVQGDERAKKLTYKDDLTHLNLLPPSNEVFCGNGFDVHKFKDGDFVVLCGVKVPYSKAFLAHSDGDVALHALCDAMLGAAGLGDIGELYPDNDPRFKDIDSKLLLNDTLKRINEVGFKLINVDITILAEAPKINPHKELMRKTVADILKLGQNKVNIKATTTEKLGFVGRSEGIATIATANLRYFNWQEVL